MSEQLRRLPYEHARFTPGMFVYVSSKIKDIHPDCPLAGRVAQATIGYYSPVELQKDSYGAKFIELFRKAYGYPPEVHYANLVPVLLDGDTTLYYAEEEYVSKVE